MARRARGRRWPAGRPERHAGGAETWRYLPIRLGRRLIIAQRTWGGAGFVRPSTGILREPVRPVTGDATEPCDSSPAGDHPADHWEDHHVGGSLSGAARDVAPYRR